MPSLLCQSAESQAEGLARGEVHGIRSLWNRSCLDLLNQIPRGLYGLSMWSLSSTSGAGRERKMIIKMSAQSTPKMDALTSQVRSFGSNYLESCLILNGFHPLKMRSRLGQSNTNPGSQYEKRLHQYTLEYSS